MILRLRENRRGSSSIPLPGRDLNIMAGWWLSPTHLKNMRVNWDDYSIPNCFWKVKKSCSSHHQPVMVVQWVSMDFLWVYYGFSYGFIRIILALVGGWTPPLLKNMTSSLFSGIPNCLNGRKDNPVMFQTTRNQSSHKWENATLVGGIHLIHLTPTDFKRSFSWTRWIATWGEVPSGKLT